MSQRRIRRSVTDTSILLANIGTRRSKWQREFSGNCGRFHSVVPEPTLTRQTKPAIVTPGW
jgi:hypothetical protein